MSDDEYRLLVKSMKAQGDLSITTIDENNRVVGGNQRLRAMKDLGWDKITAKRLIGYSDNELKAANLALNKISGNWDVELLDKWIAELTSEKFDMELTGFDDIDPTQFDVNHVVPDSLIQGKKPGARLGMTFGFKSKKALEAVIGWNGNKQGDGERLYRVMKKAGIIKD